jgi:primosomal protein N''
VEEAHALLARLDRIEALDREEAPAERLLPELRALVREAEAWARRERDPGGATCEVRRAEAAAAAVASACEGVLGDAIVPA